MLAALLGIRHVYLVILLIILSNFFDIWFGEGYRIVCVDDAGFDNCVENMYFFI